MDALIHVANLVLLISFSIKSMLWLRALNIVAGGFFIAWAFSFDPVLWAPVAWNVLFAMVNVWRIYVAILERRPPHLTAEEQRLHATVFSMLDARSFRRLLDIGQWEHGLPPALLVGSGQQPERVWMVADGCIEVRRSGEVVRRIEAGDFVGETAFLTRRPMSADVVIGEPVRFVSWPVVELERFLDEQPEIGAAVQRVVGQCLVRKLHTA